MNAGKKLNQLQLDDEEQLLENEKDPTSQITPRQKCEAINVKDLTLESDKTLKSSKLALHSSHVVTRSQMKALMNQQKSLKAAKELEDSFEESKNPVRANKRKRDQKYSRKCNQEGTRHHHLIDQEEESN